MQSNTVAQAQNVKGAQLSFGDASASVSRICDDLSRIEQEMDLFAETYGGVVFWPLIRIDVYYHLATHFGVFEEPHPISRSFGTKFRRAWRRIHSAIFYNPFLGKKSRYAVCLHARKIDGREIYSDQLIQELENDAPLLIDFPMVNQGYLHNNYGKCSRYDFCRLVARLAAFVFPAKGSAEETAFLKNLLNRIENLFGTEAISARKIARAVSSFRYEAAMYRALLRLKSVEHLFIVTGYSNREIIHGAKMAGCQVHEIQHGTITPYHLGYSFPETVTVPYTPDTLLTFGDFWHRSTKLGATTRGVTIGSSNLERYRGRPKNPDQVIVLSQGAIGRKLFVLAAELARLRSDLVFIFNPHPSETPEDYGDVLDEPLPANLTIRSAESPFFQELAVSTYQVGVFSTALYEGMSLGNRTLLFDLSGIEYMRPVIASGDAILCQSAAEAAERIDQAPLAGRTEDYYAPAVPSILDALEIDAVSRLP